MTYEEKLDEVLEWQKQQAEKDRRIKELEAQIEGKENEFKYFSNSFKKKIAELEAQIEKMKCCPNCDFIFWDGNCYYGKECKNKDHWKLRR